MVVNEVYVVYGSTYGAYNYGAYVDITEADDDYKRMDSQFVAAFQEIIDSRINEEFLTHPNEHGGLQ